MNTHPALMLELLNSPPLGHKAYLLVDNGAYDGEWLAARPEGAPAKLPPLIARLRRSGLPHQALWGQLDDPDESAVAPLLVEWNGSAGGETFLRLLDNATPGRCALSLLYCAEPSQRVAERLRKRMDLPLMGDNYLLRYFDTRVLPELMACLSPKQASSFVSLASAWYYRNRDDQWQALPSGDEALLGLDDEGLPLELGAAQCDAFLRIGSADRLEAAIAKIVGDDNALSQKAPGERYRWLRTRQEEAEGENIVEHDGQLQYCLRALSTE
jgi:hypothetical protein